MKWFTENFRTIVYISFIVPILTVAFVSISHVTTWYGLTNPISWAIYLSFGIEIAALSALAAISANMGSKVYFPFGIVTLIQFIGNIFFAYQYIDVDGQSFKDWVDLVDPMVVYLGIENGDTIGHKRFLALFSGGMLPIISLSFLHMLVKFEEENKNQTYLVKEVVSETKVKEVVSEPKIEEVVTKTNIEDVIIEPKVKEVVSEPKIEEVVSETNIEDVVSETNIEDVIIEPKAEEVVSETNIEDKSLIDEYRIANENKFNFLNNLTTTEELNLEGNDEEEHKPSESEKGIRRLSYMRRDA